MNQWIATKKKASEVLRKSLIRRAASNGAARVAPCTPEKRCFTYAWIIHWRIPLHNLSLSVNEKLGEIPLNVVSQRPFPLGLRLHPVPQGVSVIAVDVDFAEHVKLCVVGLGKLLDLLLRPGLLFPKLVAGEAQDT